MKKDTVESKRVGKLLRAKAKRCYHNAWRVIQEVPGYAEADYVEGMAVLGRLPLEHGWVEKDGVIVDATLPVDNATYFPGLRFSGQRSLATAFRIPKPSYTEDLPIFYRFGWGGINSPGFRAALVAAYRHAGMEDLAKRYEDYTPAHATKVLPGGRLAVVVPPIGDQPAAAEEMAQ